MGSNIPVDVFSPKTKASMTTMMMPIPFIPDFDKPNIKTVKQIATHWKTVKL